MRCYYNENDPKAAAWLRELIRAGVLPVGDVDERDIRDIRPGDVGGYDQCHFFAGIGIWAGVLAVSGWPADRRVWTGSCPCQPFSAAGRRNGFDDERHLWPHWHWLIGECRPGVVLGEQVASKDGLGWLDLVSADLEAEDYAIGAVDICAAGFGAAPGESRFLSEAAGDIRRAADLLPDAALAEELVALADHLGREVVDGGSHIRQRLYFVGLADDDQRTRGQGFADDGGSDRRGGAEQGTGSGGDRGAGRLADDDDAGPQGRRVLPERADERASRPGSMEDRPDPHHDEGQDRDWLLCTDGKWRPVEGGTFPLADEDPARVGRLRGYGNALDFSTAKAFVEAVMDVLP